jgi:hypothetical protein
MLSKKPGFCGWFPKITVDREKETRFLGEVSGGCSLGKRNRVSFVENKDNRGKQKRNPVSEFLGGGKRNRVSVMVSKDNCDIPKRNPVSGFCCLGRNKKEFI